MTVAHLTRNELVSLFRENGWEIIDDYWEVKRIAFKKGDVNFNIQALHAYYHPMVARLCRDWGIEIPEKCRKPQEQWEAYKKMKEDEKDKPYDN